MRTPAKQQNRLCIYAKDIALITGKTERTGQRILEQIRAAYGKRPGAQITVSEFCAFSEIEEEIVREMIF